MESSAYMIGALFMTIGGLAVLVLSVGCVLWIALSVWVFASIRFRKIVSAESLIFEYKKYREQFLAWMQIKDGESDDQP